MNKHFKRLIVFSFAVFFLILGVIGLALPFLQGFLFIAIGLVLLSIAWPPAGEWIERHTVGYPKVHAFVQRVEKRVRELIGD